MARPKWQQKIVDQLEARPMCFVKGTTVVKHIGCLTPSESVGKKITLIYITNYSHFNTCATCGVTVR